MQINEIHKKLKKIKFNFFIYIVLLPWLIVALYYVLLASPRFLSSTIVTLKQNETTSVPDPSLGLLSGVVSQSSSNDYLLINYIESLGMLSLLDQQLQLKKAYQNKDIDFISRLSSSVNQQDYLDYYQHMVQAEYDSEAGMITIDVQAFSPAESKEILEHIISNSQDAVDYISHTLAQQRLNFSEKQMEIARGKAIESQGQLLRFQNQYGIVNPENSISSYSTIINNMQAQLASTESELRALKSYLNENSPQVNLTKQKILALKDQIEFEKSRILQTELNSSDINNIEKSNKQLNEVLNQYTWLKLNNEFIMSEYTAAMQSYEVANIDSMKQQSYLVTIVPPNLPDDAEYPRVWYNLIALFVVLLAVYGIGRMIVTIILEHR